MRRWRRANGLVLGLVLGLIGAGRVLAEAPGDTVPGHPGVTWASLLRQVVPDLAADPGGAGFQGHLTRPLRNPGGKDYGGDPPDPVVVTAIATMRITAGGQPRLLVMADLGQTEDRVASTTLLALFEDGPKPRLLDAVDVGLDRDTAFSEHPRLRLAPGDDAVVTYSEHSNTSATYGWWMILFVRRDRLALAHLQRALSTRGCGWEDLEAPRFTVRSDPGRAYGRIVVSVAETITNSGEEGCGDGSIPRPLHRTFGAMLRWNSAREGFETTSPDLKRLDRLNRARF